MPGMRHGPLRTFRHTVESVLGLAVTLSFGLPAATSAQGTTPPSIRV